jgi:hypothetical protein
VSWRFALVANSILLGFLGAFAWLEAGNADLYYHILQEDQAVEWASLWSFFTAGGFFVLAARRQHRATGAFPWFLLGLALFCLFVAMEEISWGQRVFGYRPPDYFLAQNYQQELNLHNIAGTKARLLAFRAVILVYGIGLPFIVLVPAIDRVLDRLAVVPPPIELTPSMLAMLWIHVEYPWKLTGEVVEGALGLGFLFAAVANAARLSKQGDRGTLSLAAAAIMLVVVLAATSTWWAQRQRREDPATLELAKVEAEALANDLRALAQKRGKRSITKCGLHKRLYTFAQEKGLLQDLGVMSFANLTERGLPEARAEFFLDPWSSPYWIRDHCRKKDGPRVVFVYSFGPDRSRDSSRRDILDDDIGQLVLVEPGP